MILSINLANLCMSYWDCTKYEQKLTRFFENKIDNLSTRQPQLLDFKPVKDNIWFMGWRNHKYDHEILVKDIELMTLCMNSVITDWKREHNLSRRHLYLLCAANRVKDKKAAITVNLMVLLMEKACKREMYKYVRELCEMGHLKLINSGTYITGKKFSRVSYKYSITYSGILLVRKYTDMMRKRFELYRQMWGLRPLRAFAPLSCVLIRITIKCSGHLLKDRKWESKNLKSIEPETFRRWNNYSIIAEPKNAR